MVSEKVSVMKISSTWENCTFGVSDGPNDADILTSQTTSQHLLLLHHFSSSKPFP